MRWLLPVLAACTPAAPAAVEAEQVPEALAPLAWPDTSGALVHPVIEIPPGFARREVFVSAGHGAPDNHGNLGAWCTREEDFALDAADRLADLLDATGVFAAVRARTGHERPSYAARIRRLEASGAATMIELHSDVRADEVVLNATASDGAPCWRDDGEPGFTVLVRDRGAPALVAERLALARSLARSLADAGFPPWVGDNYEDLYVADDVPGVWLDRRNLFVLRAPSVPSVIVETHNARDGRETLRWDEPETHDAFGRAVIAALLAFHRR